MNWKKPDTSQGNLDFYKKEKSSTSVNRVEIAKLLTINSYDFCDF
jgi:hypothetical protein